ncbi:MAG: PH domain-containing protein [Planctomycetes bacterium]|nr:PH domain-containing protein [Planctomycetota bacterium]
MAGTLHPPPISSVGPEATSVDQAWPHELMRLPVNLDGGEVVILAIKPSAWFVLYDAARWLVLAFFVAGTSGWVSNAVSWASVPLLIQLASVAATLRLGIAVLRWVSRFYVLTDRRVMRIRGVWKVDVFACPLLSVRTTKLTAQPHERLVGLGTLRFNVDPPPDADGSWYSIRHPEEVHSEVRRAIKRAIDFQPHI